MRVPRLFHDLAVARGDGSYTRLLAKLAKTAVLVLDDFGLAPLTSPQRHDLLEVIEDRAERASTLITSQLPREGVARGDRGSDSGGRDCDRLIHTPGKFSGCAGKNSSPKPVINPRRGLQS